MTVPESLAGPDSDIRETVEMLRQEGVETFSSCSEEPGHSWGYPMVRCRPCDPEWLYGILIKSGYDGFYIKEYRSAHVGPQMDFIEIEFWSTDCLNRKIS